MKKICLHEDQHLYCDFDKGGVGDTCLFCGGDIRVVSYTPCPKGMEAEVILEDGKHFIPPEGQKCLVCGKKEGKCSLEEDSLYAQY